MILFLACTGAPPPATTSESPPLDTGPAQAGDYDDPIVHLGALPVDTMGMELTDAARVEDVLVLVGQQQGGHGGVWTVDVSDPDAPEQTGQADVHHVQYVCSTGTRAWGTDRGGSLVEIDLERLALAWYPVGATGDLACDDDRIVVAASPGAAVFDATGTTELDLLEGQWTGVALAGDVIYTAGPSGVARWRDGEQTHAVEQGGWCRDLVLGAALAASCGAEGVLLLDPDDLTVLGAWSGHASARSTAWAGDDGLWVAAWTEALFLDVSDPAAIELVGAESSPSAAMAVVTTEDRAWVADWNQPFAAQAVDVQAPEIRLLPDTSFPGQTVQIANDGRAPLVLEVPAGVTVQDRVVEPGGRTILQVPSDWAEASIEVTSDDPDEPLVAIEIGTQNGQLLGQPAPDIQELDLEGELWELADQRGEVVWLATYESG